jgi:7-cyano-7-deazaguanine synthase
MLYWLLNEGYQVNDAASFDYGQRHAKELTYARKHCQALNIKHHIIDLSESGLDRILRESGSSLVDGSVDVPHGHYAADNMAATVVPNRNMMMLSIAGAIAVATKADAVATGVHAGDHDIYPDCRPSFIWAMNEALKVGNEGFGLQSGVIAPFLHSSKADIAKLALQLHVPIDQTWSCYEGKEKHCGRCGTCVERLEALDQASRELGYGTDTTAYEDEEYWKRVTA